MNVAQPATVICSSNDAEVLSVLAGTTRPLTGREVGRLVRRGSVAGVHRVLRRLVEHGLVDAQEAGRAVLFTLNRDHLAAPAAESVVNLRSELARRLRDEISIWEVQPVHASIFGSAARGDGDTQSDIDLFIVRRDAVQENDSLWRAQLGQLVEHVRRWTGNNASISEISQKEARRLRREKPPIVSDLRADSITLAGPSAKELFGSDG